MRWWSARIFGYRASSEEPLRGMRDGHRKLALHRHADPAVRGQGPTPRRSCGACSGCRSCSTSPSASSSTSIVIVVGLVAARLVVTRARHFRGDLRRRLHLRGGHVGAGQRSSSRWAACSASARSGRLLTGRYVRPRREQRAFLLIDMKNSTGIAERLGAVRFHELLNDFFRDIAEAALECERGDPQVRRRRGHPDLARRRAPRSTATCSPAPSSLRDFIAANSAQYRRRFGVVPEFRAALHCGEIVAGEIGDVRARDRLCRRHAERGGAAARGRQGAGPRRAGLGRPAGAGRRCRPASSPKPLPTLDRARPRGAARHRRASAAS